MEKIDSLAYFRLNKIQDEKAYKFNKIAEEAFPRVVPNLEDKQYYTSLHNTTRFLIAREFDFQKALTMWENWCKWRVSYRPHEIKFEEISTDLYSGKSFHIGEDNHHNAIVYVQMCKNDPNTSDEESLRFGVWSVETATALSEQVYGGKKITIIFDKRNFTKKQMSKSGTKILKEGIKIMQDYYPERLERCYLIGADWFFRVLFGIVRPFLSEKTRNKIHLADDNEQLLKSISKDNLIKEYGGNVDFKYDAWNVFRRLEILKQEKAKHVNEGAAGTNLIPTLKIVKEENMVEQSSKSNDYKSTESDERELEAVSEELSKVSITFPSYQSTYNFGKF